MQRLQKMAKEHSVRVTILGGDVHLGALGRFYSKPDQNIKAEHDWRYMVNLVSSAITNKPPPMAVANLLARRNKIHHLDHDTDETMVYFFDKDPGAGQPDVKAKTADSNHCMMPSRNYAIIAESRQKTGGHNATTNGVHNNTTNGQLANGEATNGNVQNGTNGTTNGTTATTTGGHPHFPFPKNPRDPIHHGEKDLGTTHPAASGTTPSGLGGENGLDICLRVEIDPSDRQGKTEGYGFSVPGLESGSYQGMGKTW